MKKIMQQPTKYMLKINGLNYVCTAVLTILDVVTYLGFNKNVIVIDFNGILLEKNLWKKTFLRNKDSLEILSVAGGG